MLNPLAKRKQEHDIQICVKKIHDGALRFRANLAKMDAAQTPREQDKWMSEAKSELKKLQRLRDQVRDWVDSGQKHLDIDMLLEARRDVEVEMELFKELEKSLKVKPFAQATLGQQQEQSAEERAKEESEQWLRRVKDQLTEQIELIEADLEQLLSKADAKRPLSRAAELDELATRHKLHITHLEQVQRLLHNDEVTPEHIQQRLKDSMEDYLERAREPDFVEDEGMFDDLLPEGVSMVGLIGAHVSYLLKQPIQEEPEVLDSVRVLEVARKTKPVKRTKQTAGKGGKDKGKIKAHMPQAQQPVPAMAAAAEADPQPGSSSAAEPAPARACASAVQAGGPGGKTNGLEGSLAAGAAQAAPAAESPASSAQPLQPAAAQLPAAVSVAAAVSTQHAAEPTSEQSVHTAASQPAVTVPAVSAKLPGTAAPPVPAVPAVLIAEAEAVPAPASSAAAATPPKKAPAQRAAAELALREDTSEGPMRPAKLSTAGRAATQVAAHSSPSLERNPAQALRQPEQGTELQAPAPAAPLEQLPAPRDSITPATSLLPAAQPLRPSMQRGTAGPQQALGLPPLRHGEAGQPGDSLGTEGVHPAAGQVPDARTAGSPPPPMQSQGSSPWPQLTMATLAAWHQSGQPPDTAMHPPATQAQARGLAEESAAQAAFSFPPPPGDPQQWWVQQWAQPLFSGAMQCQQSASCQAGDPLAGSQEQARSGPMSAASAALQQLRTGHNMFAAGVTAGAAAHGSPAGPLGHHVAAGLHPQGGAIPQVPGPQQQDRAGAAGRLPAGDHHFSHGSHDSGSSATSCPASCSIAAGQAPARLPGYPGPQASMQQRAAQLHSTLQQQAAEPSKAPREQTLTPQEVPAALHQAGHNQAVAGAAWQQLRHGCSLIDLGGAAAMAAAGGAAGASQASTEDTLHCVLAAGGRPGSPAEHSPKMGPVPHMGGRNSADVCLHRAGISDPEARAQDLHQQSQHTSVAGAAAAVRLHLQEIAVNISIAEMLLHNARTSPGPASEQGTGRGLPAAGQAASQDQEQLAKANLHSGWWQQLAAAGGAAPLPRGVVPGQPSLGQGQPTGSLQGRGAGLLDGLAGTRATDPASHAPQAVLPSHQSLAPAWQAAHQTGQPVLQQAPSAVSQAGGVLLQQPEGGRAAGASPLAEVQGSFTEAPKCLQAQQPSPPRHKGAAEALPHSSATEVPPEEGGPGATAAVAEAGVEAALVGQLWQSLPQEPGEQMQGPEEGCWHALGSPQIEEAVGAVEGLLYTLSERAAAAGGAPAKTATPQERLRRAQSQAEAAERVLAASVIVLPEDSCTHLTGCLRRDGMRRNAFSEVAELRAQEEERLERSRLPRSAVNPMRQPLPALRPSLGQPPALRLKYAALRRGFPQLPLSTQDAERFRSAAFWRKVARKPQAGLDLLMFAFYFETGTAQQLVAAKLLNLAGWVFHKDSGNWFRPLGLEGSAEVPEPVGNRLTWPGSLIVFQPGLELTALGQAALRMEGHVCNPVSIPLMHTASHLLGWGPQLQAHAAVMNVSDVDL